MTSNRPAVFVAAIMSLAVALVGCADDDLVSEVAALRPGLSTVVADDQTDVVVQPEGFSTVQARITDANGEVCEVCLWLADDADERAQGLMGVTDLGQPVGMAFRFEEPRLGRFWMFQTPTPLSIAWFGEDGGLVGTADMQPCIGVPTRWCQKYSPDSEYVLAIEVFEGGLEPLGLEPGSRVELIEGSEAERCPVAP